MAGPTVRRPSRVARGDMVAARNTNLPYFTQPDKKGSYDEKSRSPRMEPSYDRPIIKGSGGPQPAGRASMGHTAHYATGSRSTRTSNQIKREQSQRPPYTRQFKDGPSGLDTVGRKPRDRTLGGRKSPGRGRPSPRG